jgi:putative Mn2+ efflux pump MntP
LIIGRELAGEVAETGRWIGAVVLAVLGLWTMWAALAGGFRGQELARRASTWGGLAGLAAGLSIDNLVVGFALGLGGASPLIVAAVIAGFSVGFTLAGLRLGAEGRHRRPQSTEFLAGVALLVVAVGVGAGWFG